MARGRGPSPTIDVHALASWMDRDVDWLQHVIQYNFGCGCDFNHEDIVSCKIWRAMQAKMAADDALERAKAEFDKETSDTEQQEYEEDL